MKDCLFCKIANNEIKANVVYQDDRAVAFRDTNPQAPLHVLVIPRAHVASINDVRDAHEADMGHLFAVAARVAEQEGLAERGYRTVMNCGSEAGQSVFHVHLHVLGGKHLGWPPFPGATRASVH
jgi:histidine triad (HIT) family protein